MDEMKIVELMQNQDSRGLEALIERYRRLACSIAQSVLGGFHQDVQECVNSAFYDVWLSMGSYDSRQSSLKGWVALMTRRRAIDLLRKNLRHREALLDFDEDALVVDDTCTEFIQRDIYVKLFNEFVQGLSEPDRSIFVRRFFALETIPAIAERYNITRGAVDNRLSRMRKALKLTLEGRL